MGEPPAYPAKVRCHRLLLSAIEKLEHRIGELETENARLHRLLDRSENDEPTKKYENR